MPTSCSAISIPPTSSAAPWRSTSAAARGGHAPARGARRASTVTGLAWGIHDVVNENMANAARVHIAEHGKDPRRYALLATGGAGPVHAYYVAKKLGLQRLIAPRARRRRLGARPADRAGPRRSRGDRRARAGPDRLARPRGDLRAARGRGQGRAGRDPARRSRPPPSSGSPTSATWARPPSSSCRLPPAPTRPPRAAP